METQPEQGPQEASQEHIQEPPLAPIQQSPEDAPSEPDKAQPVFLLKNERSWLDYAQLVVASLTLLVLIFYTGYTAQIASFTQDTLHVNERTLAAIERTQKQHLEPDLACLLENIHDRFPIFVLLNEGQIDAESVSVNHFTFTYMKISQKGGLGFQPSVGQRPGFRWLYKPVLERNARISKEILAGAPPDDMDAIFVLGFYVSYLRPTDGKLGQKQCVFYRDGGHYETRTSFKLNPHFDAVNEQMERLLEKTLGWIAQGPDRIRE